MKRTAKHMLGDRWDRNACFWRWRACTTTTSSVNAALMAIKAVTTANWGRSITFGVHTHGSGW